MVALPIVYALTQQNHVYKPPRKVIHALFVLQTRIHSPSLVTSHSFNLTYILLILKSLFIMRTTILSAILALSAVALSQSLTGLPTCAVSTAPSFAPRKGSINRLELAKCCSEWCPKLRLRAD